MDMTTVVQFVDEGIEFVKVIVMGITKLIPIVMQYPEASAIIGVVAYLNRRVIKRKLRTLFRYVIVGM